MQNMSTIKSFWNRGIIFIAAVGLSIMGIAPSRGQAPPEPAPAAEAEPGAAFIANYDPSKSYSRLLFPTVAAMVGLTPAQQEEVTRLMTERSAALAAATDQNQWPEIVQKSEEQLKALLKPEQLKNFEQAINDKLITIRFSKEPWANVLKWFSAELGLQLVMNAPPPGTFNYNDKNSYTPKEALDILNGRLQFQGYTLLRTGNMLYVHNFKDGPIPMQFLPKVTVEELPEQSRFSYVALTLPLGQRPLAKVLAAIKPFQGPYNSTQALTGNALLIVDSVNALREIVQVALGILNPPIPPALTLPVWQTYVLTNVSPTFVDNEVKKFIPSARPLYNPAASQISYLAIPSVHAVIDGLVKHLEEGGDPSKDQTVKVYPLDNITNMSEENLRIVSQRFNIPLEYLLGSGTMLEIGKEIAEGLQTLCPGATIVFNEMTKQMMVVAMPEDQEKIKKAVEQLQTPMSQPQKETFAVYDMGSDKVMSTREVSALQRMVPGAQISYDKTKNSLLVVGSPRDQKSMADAVAALKEHYAALTQERSFLSLSMTAKQLAQFNAVFEKLQDDSEMEGLLKVDDDASNRVNFWGTKSQLESVRTIAEQLTGTPIPPIPTNPTSPLTDPEPSADGPLPEGGETSARPLDPQNFQTASNEGGAADAGAAASGTFMKIFRLEKADPKAASELLRNTIAGIEIDQVAGENTLVIYGAPGALDSARRLIDELELSGKKAVETISYTNTFPFAALAALRQEEPTVTLTQDPLRKQFILFGPADAVRRMSGHLNALLQASPETEESLRYLATEREIPDEVVSYVQRLFPRLKLTYNKDDNQFTLIGSDSDREGAVRIIREAEESLPELEETRYYLLDRRVSDEFLDRMRDVLSGAKEIERSDDNPRVMKVKARPETLDQVMDEIRRLNEEYPDVQEKLFVTYPLEEELKASFDALLPEFEHENGEIRLIGYENEILGIWATPAQHKNLKELVDRLRGEGLSEEAQKTATYYNLQYADGASLIPVVREIVPAATLSVDPDGSRLLVRGAKKDVDKALRFLETLDVKPPVAEADRFVRIEPRRLPAATLSALIRAAFPKLTPTVESSTGALLINLGRVPKEDLLAFVDLADPAEPSPLSPTLKVYAFEKTPTAVVADAVKRLVPSAQVILQPAAKRMMVIAKPVDLETIDQHIGEIEGAVSPAEPFVKFYAFDKEPTDDVVHSLTTSLKQIAPQAIVEVNKNARQLMVIADADEQGKIEESLKSIIETFDPVDLKLVAYPISGMDADRLREALEKIYPDLKIETDTQGRRLLIWATLDEHVRISDEIAEVNAESDPDSPDYEGPKCVVYSAKNGGEARMLQRLIQTMFPSAEVYTESVSSSSPWDFDEEEAYWTDRLVGEQKLTVFAPAREQTMIAEIFEQYTSPSNLPERQLRSWPYGELEPQTVEVMIQSILPAAQSLSPSAAGGSDDSNVPSVKENTSFFRVDPRTRTVSVYAAVDELEKVAGLLNQLAETEGASEMRSGVYPLSSPIASQILPELSKLVPGAQFTAADPYQIIAFATEADQKTVARFLSELSDLETAGTHFLMKSVFLPEGCRVPRDSVVHYLTVQFLRMKGYAYSAANSNQIILWGTSRVIGEMEKFIDETCSANQEETYRSYPVDHLPVPEAVGLLKQLAPNASISPDMTNKRVTVLASPFVQKQVESALAEIDAKRTGDAALSAKYYNMEGMTPALFPSVYTALIRQFPQAVIVADPVYLQFTIVATGAQQEQIAGFFNSMKEKRLESTPVFEVYTLSRMSFRTLQPILAASLPGVPIFPGKQPGEFYAFAKPEDQDKIRGIASKVDTIDDEAGAALVPKVYRVDAKHAYQAVVQLAPSLPGAQLYPLSGGGVLMWGAPADHELAEKYFGTFAEAYPEPVIRRYSLKHIRFADAAAFLTRAYPTEAVIYPESDGDLLAEASEPVQKKIAESLEQIDVPQDEGSQPSAKAYSIADLPAASQPTAISSILRVAPEAVFLPTATPGYFVIYAKPKDQEKIGGILGEMTAESPNRHARLEKYSLRNVTYADAVRLIAEVAPTARPNPGKDANQVYVWATDADHARIAGAVQKLNEEVTDGIVPRVYHLSKANLIQAQTAIRTLYPTQVQSIIDLPSRTLTVNASALHQEKVAELISEIERNDAETQPQIHVFNITGISSTPILTHLHALYVSDPEFKVNYDAQNQSLLVQGSPRQIQMASDLIAQIRRGGLSDQGMMPKTYTLRNSLAYYTLRSIFQRQGRTVDMQLDYSTGKLVVIALPEEHRTIENVLEALAPEPTVLAVYDLVELDPETAANIISTMLETDGTFVDVQPDLTADKLYIRATEQKQEEIRRFLIEAGETSLIDRSTRGAATTRPASSTSVQGSGSFRTIRSDADLREAVSRASLSWGRPNPVRVVNEGQGSLIQTRENPEGTSSDTPDSEPAPAPDSEPDETDPAADRDAASATDKENASLLNRLVRGAVLLASQAEFAEGSSSAAVYVIFNDDHSLTITSSDTAALDEFESRLLAILDEAQEEGAVDFFNGSPADRRTSSASRETKNLRALTRQHRKEAENHLVMEDRDYSVYKVENVSVEQMIARLRIYMADKLTPRPTAPATTNRNGVTVKPISSGARLSFQPDNVMNTIMVKGKKADRDEAGAMIALLDRAELFPQPITKPVKIPVRNTSVTKMAQQVLNVFQLKFMSIKLPGGLSPRILPNVDTNVLEVFAPKELAEEIAQYVRETDEEILEDKTSQVKIIPLEEVNAVVFQKYIDNLKGPQSNYILVSPYTINPQYTRQPRQF